MKISEDRILTTHTGSLPRYPPILGLLRKDGGRNGGDDLRSAAPNAVAWAVEQQLDAGIAVINDGEQAKPDYSTYIKDRLEGFAGPTVDLGPTRDGRDFPDYAEAVAGSGNGRPSGPACTGPIKWKNFDAVERDITNLKQAVARSHGAVDVFMSAVSPGQAARFMPNRYYDNEDDYLTALAEALRFEYEAIVSAGFILQLDCPDLASGWNNQYRDCTVDEFRTVLHRHVDVLNEAVKNIPADRMRMHICWGNYEGPHNHDIPLRNIIDIALRARPAGLSFESANPRHAHEWKVFMDIKLPAEKIVIPGVIDSTTNFVEHPELVADRIICFAKIVGRERVIAGTDCGFATSAFGGAVYPSVAWAKLRTLAQGAELATKALWPA